MPKRSIRAKFLCARKELTVQACADLSSEIQRRFLRSDLFRNASSIALYSALHNEVLTDAVARQAFAAGKTVSYPRVRGDLLEFVTVDSLADLAPGAFGVLEPQGNRLLGRAELDLIVVPGVVFDSVGHRLGYGRGFYDRALDCCRKDCMKVGFAYELQMVETLPIVEHDKALTALVTEHRILNFSA